MTVLQYEAMCEHFKIREQDLKSLLEIKSMETISSSRIIKECK